MSFALPTFKRLAVPCVILVAAGLASRAQAEEYVKSYSVAGRADVRVYTDDSSVRVTTSDTNTVEFRVKYEGFAAVQVGSKPRIDSQQNGDHVELTALLGRGVTLGINTRRMSTEVHMPRNADLQLETRDGRVEVASLNGNITVRTTDGAIKASQLSGKIDLNSKDGGIDVDRLTGDFRLQTTDGAIEAAHLDGKCAASSKDGSIRVAGRFEFLDLASGDGGVVAQIAPGSRISSAWSVRTGDGGIDVTLPKDFQVNLDASTRDGHITLGLPVAVQGRFDQSRVQGTLNGGGPPLVIRTGDGSIRLKGA
jgi:translation initiation factor IF-1